MSKPIRIKSTDTLGNVAFIYQTRSGDWTCALANGTPASMGYAGVPNETQCRFDLEDATTAKEALAAVRKHAYSHYKHEVL